MINMNNALQTWINLVSIQDVDAVVNLYADDAVLLGTFSDKIRVGKDEIREYFNFFLAKKPKASVIDSKIHMIDENNITINGFYDFEVNNEAGGRSLSHARFTFVFQKQDANIKILSHHSSVMPS